MFKVTLNNYQLILLLVLGISVCGFCPEVFSQCPRAAKAPDYSVCLPEHWGFLVNNDADGIELCNRAEVRQCQFIPFGNPDRGAVVLRIIPSDRGYGIYQSPEELIRNARITGRQPPEIKEVELRRGDRGVERKCWVARKLLPGGLWDDTYTLTVGGRRFRIAALYNDEKGRIESYREDCLRVLESITPINTTSPKGGR